MELVHLLSYTAEIHPWLDESQWSLQKQPHLRFSSYNVILTCMPPYVEKFLDKYWKASAQTLFYAILVMILTKIIYPSFLQQKYFLLLNSNRDNPGFPTLILGELHKPGNSSCCWGCWMQWIVSIPRLKTRAGSFWCLGGLCGSRSQWGSRCRGSILALRIDDHPRRSRSDKGREIQRRWREGRKQGVRLKCKDMLYPLLVV